MEPNNKDFYQNMNHLVDLLKKMISHIPFQPSKDGSPANPSAGDGNVNLNFCFFNFLPVSPEDMEEFEEMCQDFLASHEEKAGELKPELTTTDLEFLRRHGIRF